MFANSSIREESSQLDCLNSSQELRICHHDSHLLHTNHKRRHQKAIQCFHTIQSPQTQSIMCQVRIFGIQKDQEHPRNLCESLAKHKICTEENPSHLTLSHFRYEL